MAKKRRRAVQRRKPRKPRRSHIGTGTGATVAEPPAAPVTGEATDDDVPFEESAEELGVDAFEEARPYDPELVYEEERDEARFDDDDPEVDDDDENDEDDEDSDEESEGGGLLEYLDMEFDDIDDENRPR